MSSNQSQMNGSTDSVGREGVYSSAMDTTATTSSSNNFQALLVAAAEASSKEQEQQQQQQQQQQQPQNTLAKKDPPVPARATCLESLPPLTIASREKAKQCPASGTLNGSEDAPTPSGSAPTVGTTLSTSTASTCSVSTSTVSTVVASNRRTNQQDGLLDKKPAAAVHNKTQDMTPARTAPGANPKNSTKTQEPPKKKTPPLAYAPVLWDEPNHGHDNAKEDSSTTATTTSSSSANIRAAFAPRVVATAVQMDLKKRNKAHSNLHEKQDGDDPVPGETLKEKKRRLNRINARRKRARKVLKIDYFTEQHYTLVQTNETLKEENATLRSQIRLVQQLLKDQKTTATSASRETASVVAEGQPKAVLPAGNAPELALGKHNFINPSMPAKALGTPHSSVAPAPAVGSTSMEALLRRLIASFNNSMPPNASASSDDSLFLQQINQCLQLVLGVEVNKLQTNNEGTGSNNVQIDTTQALILIDRLVAMRLDQKKNPQQNGQLKQSSQEAVARIGNCAAGSETQRNVATGTLAHSSNSNTNQVVTPSTRTQSVEAVMACLSNLVGPSVTNPMSTANQPLNQCITNAPVAQLCPHQNPSQVLVLIQPQPLHQSCQVQPTIHYASQNQLQTQPTFQNSNTTPTPPPPMAPPPQIQQLQQTNLLNSTWAGAQLPTAPMAFAPSAVQQCISNSSHPNPQGSVTVLPVVTVDPQVLQQAFLSMMSQSSMPTLG